MTDDLDQRLAPYLRRADRLIVGGFDDVRAHARTGNLAGAARRLAELQQALIGPNGSGLIGDARASFFRDAFGPFDPELHDPMRRVPMPAAVDVARTAPILGRHAYIDATHLIDHARSDLVVASAPRHADRDALHAAIDTWHDRHSGAIRAWARRTLSDSQMAIHRVVADWRLKPEYRPALET